MVDIERINNAVSGLSWAKDRYNEALAEAQQCGITVEIFLPDIEKYVASPKKFQPGATIVSQRMTLELHP